MNHDLYGAFELSLQIKSRITCRATSISLMLCAMCSLSKVMIACMNPMLQKAIAA